MSTQPTVSRPPSDGPVGMGEVPVLLFIRGLAFFTAMLSLVLGLHYYLGVRLIRGAQMPEPFATLAWVALFGAFACIPAGFILGRLLPRKIAGLVQWVGFIWMG